MGYLQSTTSYVDFEWPVSGWYRRVAGLAHTHTHVYTRTIHTHIPAARLVSICPQKFKSPLHIYIHTHTIYVPIRIYKTINFSLSLSFHPSIYLSFTVSPSNISFRVPFPRLAFMAGIHGSGEIRVPSTLKLVIETWARNTEPRPRRNHAKIHG